MKHRSYLSIFAFRATWITVLAVLFAMGNCSCESGQRINRSGPASGTAQTPATNSSTSSGDQGSVLSDSSGSSEDSNQVDSSAVSDSTTTDSTALSLADTTASDSSTTAASQDSISGLPRLYTYRIVETYPHDHDAFTQGLVVQDSILYEGTGLYGESTLRKVSLNTGEVLKRVDLDSRYFGEGLTAIGNRLVQLTWKSEVGFVYDKASFEQTGSFTYPTEGWGITYDGERLIMSTGSSTLYFRDPETFEETGRLEVTANLSPVANLNELEFVEGEIFANVWQTDRIAIISPQTGQVTGWLDLSGIVPSEERLESGAVLNGIAYDDKDKRLYVTGKLWPYLFEIELVPSE